LLLPVLERPEAGAHAELFAAALVTAAILAREAGLPAAEQLGERAVELARRLGDDRLIIEALSALCAYCYFAGQPERGFRLARKPSSARASSATISCWASACCFGC
jgi:hypothetical protein